MSVLTARGAGVRRRRRWLFRDLDVTVEPGEMVAVVGPPGSGRTTVLLALARRFRLNAGRVDVDGTAALGHVPQVSVPEPVFTVAEHVRERLALLGRPRSGAAEVPLHGLEPGRRGRELSPYEKQVLGLILAGLGGPAVIALDGVDDGLDASEQAELWSLLAEIAAAGTAVLVTAREIDADRVTTVIRLGAEPKTESAAAPQPGMETAEAARQGSPEAGPGVGEAARQVSREVEPEAGEAERHGPAEAEVPAGVGEPAEPVRAVETAGADMSVGAEPPLEMAVAEIGGRR